MTSIVESFRKLADNARRTPLVRHGLALVGSRAATFVTGAISLVLFGKLFTTDAIGTIALYEMVVALALTLGFRWSSVGLVRFGREELLRAGTMHESSSNRLALVLPLLVLFAAGALLFRHELLDYVGSNDPLLIYYLVLALVIMVARDHYVALYSAAERHPMNAAVHFGLSLGKLLALSWLWFMHPHASAETYIKLLVTVDAVLLVPLIAGANRTYLMPLQRPDWNDFLRMLRFVAPQILGFAALYVINWVDTYFIRLYMSSAVLGSYQFVYSIFMKLSSLAFILDAVFFPRIIGWNRSEPETAVRYVRLAPPILLAGLGTAVLVGALSSGPVLTWAFGDKYVVAYPSFHLMLAAVPFYFLSLLYVPLLNAGNRLATVQSGNVLAALVNLAIDFFMVERFGIVAAALGTFVAIQMRTLLLMVVAHRMTGVGCGRWIALSLAATAGAVWYFLTVARA